MRSTRGDFCGQGIRFNQAEYQEIAIIVNLAVAKQVLYVLKLINPRVQYYEYRVNLAAAAKRPGESWNCRASVTACCDASLTDLPRALSSTSDAYIHLSRPKTTTVYKVVMSGPAPNFQLHVRMPVLEDEVTAGGERCLANVRGNNHRLPSSTISAVNFSQDCYIIR